MLEPLSMGQADRNARLRERRRRRRRQIRIRRAVALAVLLGLAAGIALGARAVGGGHKATTPSAHHTPRAAAHKWVARVVHAHGIYLIGRVVTFEDPVLSEKRPALAIRNSDGTLWHNNAGLGWTNPYDRRVWAYNDNVAAAAAKAGYDEIQFDYVRFPSDGDLTQIRYPGPHLQTTRWTIPAFVQYAAQRLHPLGVRVSVDVFGLSATRDLGIGQLPRRVSTYADAVYPMVYPSHYNPGEYGIGQPDDRPGLVVSRSLADFRRALEGRKTRLTPWLQDFSLGRPYTLEDLQLQIAAAKAHHANGFLLWNPEGVYTTAAIAH